VTDNWQAFTADLLDPRPPRTRRRNDHGPNAEQFRTCEELDAAGESVEACTRSACVYAQQCQRCEDPEDPFNA
jgi:hypothetical protein